MNRASWEKAQELRAEHAEGPEALRVAMEEWWLSLEEVAATVSQVADHIDHVRTVAGIDHIGVGGDFDGARAMPAGLEDVSGYPALFTELAARGYTDEELQQIAGRNVLRVLREAELVATRL